MTININVIDFFENTPDEVLVSLALGDMESFKLMCYALTLELQLLQEGKFKDNMKS